MAAVVVTNSFSAIALPLVLPLIGPGDGGGFPLLALLNTLMVVLVPLLLSQLLQAIAPQVIPTLAVLKPASFYLWMLAIYLATASATHYLTTLRSNQQSLAL